PLGPIAMARWQSVGAALAETFGLRGLFGVDAIFCDGVPWPVEINPRYTASVEVVERCLRRPLLPMHRAVFEETPVPELAIPAGAPIWGKAILYARKALVFPDEGPWSPVLREDVSPETAEYADLPHAGEIIERGWPVLTLF